MFRAFHQQLGLHGDYAGTENYRRAAIYIRVVFFLSSYRQILCRQLPTRGLELIVGGLPSTGSYWALQDGFRLAVWWSWIVSDYRVCTVNVTCDYCHMSPGG